MYLWLILFAFLPSAALADGAVAVGYRGDTLVTTTAVSLSTAANARNRALLDCAALATGCKIVHDFKNTCTATVLFNDRQLDIGHGATKEAAQSQAMAACKKRGGPCSPQYISCDPATVATVPVPQSAPAPQPVPQQVPTPAPEAKTSYGFVYIGLSLVSLFLFGGYVASRLVANPAITDFILKWKTHEVTAFSTATHEQTEAARLQLIAAITLITRVITRHSNPKITVEETKELLASLDRAAEHLLKAREFDSNATIKHVSTGDEEISQHTAVSLLIFQEAICHTILAKKAPYGSAGRAHLKTAREALLQALAYYKTAEYHRALAQVYAYLGDKKKAQEQAQYALDLDLEDVETTILVNAIPTYKEMWPYPAFYELKIAALVLAGIFSIYALFTPLPYLAAVPWLAVLAWLLARNEFRKLLARIPYTYAHYREKADEKKHHEHLANLYKKRWQREK